MSYRLAGIDVPKKMLAVVVQERMVAGLSTRNYRRAVESVVEGYGIAKSSVSRQFVEASSNQLRVLCERRLEDLNLVVLMIDGIHFGG
jgi:putative transposase